MLTDTIKTIPEAKNVRPHSLLNVSYFAFYGPSNTLNSDSPAHA